MNPSLRSLGFLLLGICIGALAMLGFLGRFTVVTAAAGGDFPLIHAYRLNRISGEVIGLGRLRPGDAESIPSWYATEPDPYLSLPKSAKP